MSQEKQNKKKPTESTYTVYEFAASAKVFGADVNADCVLAAFKTAKKTEATLTEAKKVVANFMKKEVS